MIGQLLVLVAGVAMVVGLVLLVAAWRVSSWPYRRLGPRDRAVARREALLALVAAAGALAATRTPKPPAG